MHRRPFLRAAGLAALSGLVGRQTADALPSAARTASRRDGGWSFVLLPDTQCYSESHPEVFMAQTEWIARQREARNIRFVLHLGDITDDNVHPQWENAWRAMDVLRREGMPFHMVPGNHDIGPWGSGGDRTSHFSDYFMQRRCMEPGRSENAYLPLAFGETKILVIGLEFGPRDAVVEWANTIVAQHADHHAILVTHAYLYSDSSRFDWATRGRKQSWNPNSYGVGTDPDEARHGCNDGEALWQKLVSRHPQFAFTFNGHVLHDGIGHLVSAGASGREVHQMLVNYQCGTVPDRKNGGGGFLRILEVHPDGRTMQISDYSPYYDQWLDDPDRKFTITLDRSLHEAP